MQNNFEVVNNQIWNLNSEISNHMTRKKKLFTHLEENISAKD